MSGVGLYFAGFMAGLSASSVVVLATKGFSDQGLIGWATVFFLVTAVATMASVIAYNER